MGGISNPIHNNQLQGGYKKTQYERESNKNMRKKVSRNLFGGKLEVKFKGIHRRKVTWVQMTQSHEHRTNYNGIIIDKN